MIPRNCTLFVWFRVLFNCRFYYPVYAILFLDFGLNLSQFALLNVAWALSIVCLDLPLGALADVIGRKWMVVLSAALMTLEMLVFACVPVGGPWVFPVFLLNRVLSGAAEAFSSGADEALAYDSIPKADRSSVWPLVMARLNRWTALGFMVASLVGAYVFSSSEMSALFRTPLASTTTLKFPIYLCLGSALACLAVSLSLREAPHKARALSFTKKLSASCLGIKTAALWVWRTPAPLLLLTLGFLLDSIVRLFYTVASNYYRLIDITEASFGLISVAGSLLAFSSTRSMEWLVRKRSASFNFGIVILMVAWGLLALAHPVRGWFGVALLAPLLVSMRFLQFFLSHYLNEIVDSSHRATVLSLKSLSMNLAYGTLTLLFGWQTSHLAKQLFLPNEDPQVFATALTWWPCWFALTMLAYGILRTRKLHPRSPPVSLS